MSSKVIAFFDARFQESGPLWEACGRRNHWQACLDVRPQRSRHVPLMFPSRLGAYDLADPEQAGQVVGAARAAGLSGFVIDLYPVADGFLSGADRLSPWCDDSFSLAYQWDNGPRPRGGEAAFDWEAHRRTLASVVAAIAPWRWLAVGGRPMLVIRRPANLLAPQVTVALLRDEARKAGLPGLYVVANAAEDRGYTGHGFDALVDPGAAEWPSCEPVNEKSGFTLLQVLAGREDSANMLDTVLEYRAFASSRMVSRAQRGKVLPRVMPTFSDWPDHADGGATILVSNTYQQFRTFLARAMEYAGQSFPDGEQVVFLESWNHWRHGSQIEPTTRLGTMLLEDTASAIRWGRYIERTNVPGNQSRKTVGPARSAQIARICGEMERAAQAPGFQASRRKPSRDTCPACGSARLRVEEGASWGRGAVTYGLKVCGGCGFRFTDPYPTDAALAAHYALHFDYDWYQTHYAAKYIDAKRRLLEMRPWLGRSILDYGGGVGYLAEAARRLGHDAMVYDPFKDRDAVLPDRKWDTIFCLHVLEHSNDPEDFLRRLRDLLTPDGALILAVPNAAGDGYVRRGLNWTWFQPPLTHVSHFTPQALTAMAERAGLRVERLSFHERWDANTVADLEAVEQTAALEREWFRHRDPEARQRIAWRNTRYRYRALRACRHTRPDDVRLAEMLMVARLDG